MAKTSASLFVPVAECLFLSLLLHFFGSGFMLTAAPADFSPLARTLLSAQMWVSVCTTGVHAALSLLDKTLFLVGDATENAIAQYDGGGGREQYSRAANIKLASLLQLRASFRRGMDASNACCTSMLTLLLVAATGLAQALSMEGQGGLSDAAVLLLPAVLDPSLSYATPWGLSWTQAVVGGASAWTTLDGEVFRVASGFEVPVLGSMFAAILVAALGVLFLLSLYMAYVSTPEGESSLSFLDPKGLAVVNWILCTSLSFDRSGRFEACGSGVTFGGGTLLFESTSMDLVAAGIALGITCFHTFIPWPRVEGRDVGALVVGLAICTVQLVYVALRVPPTVQVVCSIVALLTMAMSIVKFAVDDDRRPRSLVSASLSMLDELLLLRPGDNEDAAPPAGSASSLNAPSAPSASAPEDAPASTITTTPTPTSGSSALFYRGIRGAVGPPQPQAHLSVDSMLVLSSPRPASSRHHHHQQQQYRQYPTTLQQHQAPPPGGTNKFHWN